MAVNNSFFSTVLPSVKSVAHLTGVEIKLYTKLLPFELIISSKSRTLLRNRAKYLIRICEDSIAYRKWDFLSEASAYLSTIPIAQARHAGAYFSACAMKRQGKRDNARSLLEQVADAPLTSYRTRAIQTLGFMQEEDDNLDEATRYYREALQVSRDHDLVAPFCTHLFLSKIKALTGDHFKSVAELVSLSGRFGPVLRHHSFYSFLYHANLASALADVGRISEAKAAFSLVEGSSFASAYPELAHTREQILHQCPNESFVALSHSSPFASEDEESGPSAGRNENLEAAATAFLADPAQSQQASPEIDSSPQERPHQYSSRSYATIRLSLPVKVSDDYQRHLLTNRNFAVVFRTPFHLLIVKRFAHCIESRAR